MKFNPSYSRIYSWVAAGLLGLGGGVMVTGYALGESKPDLNKKRPAAIDSMPAEVQRAVHNANDLSTAFRAVSEAMLPSVVAIETRTQVASNAPTQGSRIRPSQGFGDQGFGNGRNPFQGTPFEDFFRDGWGDQLQPMPGRPRSNSPLRRNPVPKAGIGSGVVIDETGIVLTNNHVVSGGDKVVIRTHDGAEYIASDVWTDPSTDIAVVKIDGAKNLVAAPLGDSDALGIGDWVLALGQPFGLKSTVTAGIISAKHRGIGITDRENFLQTDAAINPGNSGGPLVNLRGEVVGINTAIHSRSGGNNGIGFAVPSNMARWVATQLIEDGEVRRAYLGVGIQPVTHAIAERMQVPPNGGVVVTDAYPETPAAKMGLQSGDVITRFDGKPIAQPLELQLLVERSQFGKEIDVEVLREGRPVVLKYTPTQRPDQFGKPRLSSSAKPRRHPSAFELPDWGFEVTPLDAQAASNFGVNETEGLLITSVASGSIADEAGLTPGTLIKQVDRKSVKTLKELQDAMASADGNVLLFVKTNVGSRFVVLKRTN